MFLAFELSERQNAMVNIFVHQKCTFLSMHTARKKRSMGRQIHLAARQKTENQPSLSPVSRTISCRVLQARPDLPRSHVLNPAPLLCQIPSVFARSSRSSAHHTHPDPLPP